MRLTGIGARAPAALGATSRRTLFAFVRMVATRKRTWPACALGATSKVPIEAKVSGSAGMVLGKVLVDRYATSEETLALRWTIIRKQSSTVVGSGNSVA